MESELRKLFDTMTQIEESEQVDEVQGYRPGRGNEWDEVTGRIKADRERYDREGPNEIERWKQEVEARGWTLDEKYDGYTVYDDDGNVVGKFSSQGGKWLEGSDEFNPANSMMDDPALAEDEAGHPLPDKNDGLSGDDDDEMEWGDEGHGHSHDATGVGSRPGDVHLDGEDWKKFNDPWGIGEGDLDMDGEELPADHEEYGDEEFGMGGDMHRDEDLMERDVREMTNKIHQYMDEGMLDPRVVADAALSYLSEADVVDLARTYELIWDDNEELEEDKQD